MRRLVVILGTALLVGCGPLPESKMPSQSDQCMRAELFQACLKALPAGPASTQYNDWDEVVDSCSSNAYYTSMRKTTLIKPECRAQ